MLFSSSAAAPNRLSRDKIIFSENHISHILCLVLCNEGTEVASQREGASDHIDHDSYLNTHLHKALVQRKCQNWTE